MRVLLLGANGFIGRHLMASLIAAGHQPVAAVRSPASVQRRFPGYRSIAIDLNRDKDPRDWHARLDGIEAVVNCAGALTGGRGQNIDAIHHDAPRALFRACVDCGVKRFVQISAIGIDSGATDFARTKLAGDASLMATSLDWVVMRPSLVYGAGSYGGTSLMRGLAGLPGFVPLVDGGGQTFRPIFVDDLAQAVIVALESPDVVRTIQTPVGPEILTQKQILLLLRNWLDLRPARPVRIPSVVANLLASLGDHLAIGPISTTALRQVREGAADAKGDFAAAFAIQPRRMSEVLVEHPSTVQDRWHARLYFAKPLLRLTLALLWLASGMVGLLASPALVATILDGSVVPNSWWMPLSYLTSAFDIAMGLAVLFGWLGPIVFPLQIGAIGLYTLGLSIIDPGLWLAPLGGLLKNVPILTLVLIGWAMENER